MHSLRGTNREPTMWIQIVDYCVENLFQLTNPNFMGSETLCEGILGPGLSLGKLVAQSGVSLERLEKEIELIMKLSENGTSELLWPHMEIINDFLLPLFAEGMKISCDLFR